MYDAVVIGAGPAGYVCAITLAKNGAKVCVVERNGLGGTCTQRGCIPTKYLHSMGDIVRRSKEAKKFGISSDIKIDHTILQSKMRSTVSKLASGIEYLFKKNGVELIKGEATIKSQNTVEVGGRDLETKNIVIATGTRPLSLKGVDFDKTVVSTDSVFELEKIPQSMLIVGGGYSGCEFASILNAFGCKIWLVEMKENLLPELPSEVGSTIEKFMRLEGISVMTNCAIKEIQENKVTVNGQTIVPEKILINIGREADTHTAGIDNLQLELENGKIKVNQRMQTSIANIYAIGDISGQYELAHVASQQGQVAAQNILGKDKTIDYSVIPYCVFTFPEVAVVGRCEGNSAQASMVANAKANCLGDTKGFIKVFEKDGIIQGAIIIGPHASEIISEAALAIRLKLKPKDIIETVHAHPTLPEGFVDALKEITD